MHLDLNFHLCWEFVGTPLPILARYAISPPRALCASAIQASAHSRGLTVLDQEFIPPCVNPSRVPLLPFPVGLFLVRPLLLIFPQPGLIPHIPLCVRQLTVQLILLVGDQMRVRNSGIRGLQNRSLMSGLADDLNRSVFPGLDALAALANINFDTIELARFGGGIEDLGEGHAMDWKIVDRFMCLGGRFEGSGGHHGMDGFGIGKSERLVLCEAKALV